MISLKDYDKKSYSRGSSPLKELLWWAVRSLAFASWFPIPSFIKVALLRLFGAKIGKNVVIRSRVNITMPWHLQCGDYVWIGDEVYILSLASVKIGSNVCISQRAFICSGSHDFTKTNFDLIAKPIEIGHSSWVCAQAFIGPGVTLPEQCMVKAGEVIASHVKPEPMAFSR